MYSSEATLGSPMRTSLTDHGPAGLSLFAAATAAILAGAVLMSAATQAPTSAAATARPRPVAHPVSSDALPHVEGKRITTMVVEFPPGGFSPPHHHGGSVTVYVLSGVIRSQLEGQPAMVYRAGQSFFEPPGIVHLLAENMSPTEPARILAVFVADEGATLTTYH
jgi:quercetin dioxygenase-like cupin family protein